MSNVHQLLSAELRRLARKEIKVALESLVEANRVLKDRVSELEKMVKNFSATNTSSLESPNNIETPQPVSVALANRSDRTLFQPKNIKKLRKKCNLSQKQFAMLLDVSPLSVCFWEKGHVRPGPVAQRKLSELNALSKADFLQLCASHGLEFSILNGKKSHTDTEPVEPAVVVEKDAEEKTAATVDEVAIADASAEPQNN